MQMIAAVKMKKAVDAAVNTREYADTALSLLENLSKNNISHPLAKERAVKNHLIIVISSNRGLCGSYNASVLKTSRKFIESQKEQSISVIALGKKAASLSKIDAVQLDSLYEKIHENPRIEDIYPISESLIKDFLDKKIDTVSLIYTKFISGLNQQVITRSLLPISPANIKSMLEDLPGDTTHEQEEVLLDEYEFEPNKKAILNKIIPMLIETQIFQAVLESAASEHASRMIAMKSATDSASDMIDSLTLEFNKSRQAAITQEISEIVAGANAL